MKPTDTPILAHATVYYNNGRVIKPYTLPKNLIRNLGLEEGDTFTDKKIATQVSKAGMNAAIGGANNSDRIMRDFHHSERIKA
jgi:hypothetical protein